MKSSLNLTNTSDCLHVAQSNHRIDRRRSARRDIACEQPYKHNKRRNDDKNPAGMHAESRQCAAKELRERIGGDESDRKADDSQLRPFSDNKPEYVRLLGA